MASQFTNVRADFASACCLTLSSSHPKFPQIQSIREKHDKAFKRWMPHVNLLFPFIQDDGRKFGKFNVAATALEKHLVNFDPFVVSASCAKLGFFKQRGGVCTIHLAVESPTNMLSELHRTVSDLFPGLTSGKKPRKFNAHLTLGQCNEKVLDATLAEWSAILGDGDVLWRVTDVALISRSSKEDPFHIRHRVPLGGAITDSAAEGEDCLFALNEGENALSALSEGEEKGERLASGQDALSMLDAEDAGRSAVGAAEGGEPSAFGAAEGGGPLALDAPEGGGPSAVGAPESDWPSPVGAAEGGGPSAFDAAEEKKCDLLPDAQFSCSIVKIPGVPFHKITVRHCEPRWHREDFLDLIVLVVNLATMSPWRLTELCKVLKNEFGDFSHNKNKKFARGEDLLPARSPTRLRCVMISKDGVEVLETTDLEKLCSKLTKAREARPYTKPDITDITAMHSQAFELVGDIVIKNNASNSGSKARVVLCSDLVRDASCGDIRSAHSAWRTALVPLLKFFRGITNTKGALPDVVCIGGTHMLTGVSRSAKSYDRCSLERLNSWDELRRAVRFSLSQRLRSVLLSFPVPVSTHVRDWKKSASTTHAVSGRETTVNFDGWIHELEHAMLSGHDLEGEGEGEGKGEGEGEGKVEGIEGAEPTPKLANIDGDFVVRAQPLTRATRLPDTSGSWASAPAVAEMSVLRGSRAIEGQLEYNVACLFALARHVHELDTARVDLSAHASSLRNELKEINDRLMPLIQEQDENNKAEIADLAKQNLKPHEFKKMIKLIQKVRYADVRAKSMTLTALTTQARKILGELKSTLNVASVDKRRMHEILTAAAATSVNSRIFWRASKVALTDAAMNRREARKNAIPPATDAELEQCSGSIECFLSASNLREAVGDEDCLWIGGRVSRVAGVSLASPEMIHIEYISPHPMSASFFASAMSACSQFPDASRQRINCLLIPLYGSRKHFEYAMSVLEENASWTIAGVDSLFATDFYQLFYAVVGHMITRFSKTQRERALTFQAIRSLFEMSKRVKVFPFIGDHTRQYDPTKPKISLLAHSASRLARFLSRPECRTSAVYPNLNVLFADLALSELTFQRVAPTDVEAGVVNTSELWRAFLQQLARHAVNEHLPKAHETGYDKLYQEAQRQHVRVLRVLVQGLRDDPILGPEAIKVEEQKEEKTEYKFKWKSRKDTLDVVIPKKSRRSPDEMKDVESAYLCCTTRTQRNLLRSCHRLVHWSDATRAVNFLNAWWSIRKNLSLHHIFAELDRDQRLEGEEVSKKIEERVADVPSRWLKLFAPSPPKNYRGFARAAGIKLSLADMRATYALAFLTQNNKMWQKFCKRSSKPTEKLLAWLNKKLVTNDLRVAAAKAALKLKQDQRTMTRFARMEAARAIHIGNMPDFIDEDGNLPWNQCAYSSCGLRFDDIEREEKETEAQYKKRVRDRLFAHLDSFTGLSLPKMSKMRQYVVGEHKVGREVFKKLKRTGQLNRKQFVDECVKRLTNETSDKQTLNKTLKTLFDQLERGARAKGKCA